MASDTRAPWKMPARMSRPSMSDPRMYARFSPGHCIGRVTIANGSSRKTYGALTRHGDDEQEDREA